MRLAFAVAALALGAAFGQGAKECNWMYRYDAMVNDFNVEFPDMHAVYHGAVIMKTSELTMIVPQRPQARYFSVQLYDVKNADAPIGFWSDRDLLGPDGLDDPEAGFRWARDVNATSVYLLIFRVYLPMRGNPGAIPPSPLHPSWGFVPVPALRRDGGREPPCAQINSSIPSVSTNYSDINCGSHKFPYGHWVVPPSFERSLSNHDASYLITCLPPGTGTVRVSGRLPLQPCSISTVLPTLANASLYDVRYVSLSVVSMVAPRPTVKTHTFDCRAGAIDLTVDIPPDVQMPGLLYRQLLPNDDFKPSVANANAKCRNSDSTTCVQLVLGDYYPKLDVDPPSALPALAALE